MAAETVEVTYSFVKTTTEEDGTLNVTESVSLVHEGETVSYIRIRKYLPSDVIPDTEYDIAKNVGRGINPQRPTPPTPPNNP